MSCGLDRHRVIQVHPSLRCNLACLHCYSQSGPRNRTGLPTERVVALMGEAAGESYTAVSFSGGEPLLYPGLVASLDAAKGAGLATTLTTNGIPLTARRIAALRGRLDLVAISLDGPPDAHDRMRAQPGAFAGMRDRLPDLRASGIPFGFLFTLTRDNLGDLPWIADFAIAEGARLLQIHPLENAGRARETLDGRRPDDLAANAAYLATMRLQERVGDRIAVHLDLAHRDVVAAEPWRVYADALPDEAGAPLADHLDSLIVEADGTVSPVQHGFPREHALGNLAEGPLGCLADRWRRTGGPARFRAHCREVWARETHDPDALPAFDWFEAVASAAYGGDAARSPVPQAFTLA